MEGKRAIAIATEFVNSKELNLTRKFNAHPFVPQDNELHEHCEEVFSIQVAGLTQRLVHTGAKTAVVGISGGLKEAPGTHRLQSCGPRYFRRTGFNTSLIGLREDFR